MTKLTTMIALALLLTACSNDKANETPAKSAESAKASETTKPAAQVGQAAPDFTLKDLAGNEVTLASFKGKTVVLEWFNPDCPFVVKSHTKGGLVTTAKKHADAGVVWLAINSGAPGKQGHDPAVNEQRVKEYGMSHPVLRDESGKVGKAYGATNTPHMFIIDKNGTLVYAGAIDNSRDGEGQSPEGGVLINYVDQALSEMAAGKPVSVPITKAYGCGVKYTS